MSTGHGGRGTSQDFELNIASIIDCFTVLITFMLATASFLSIGILDAGVAAAGAQAAPGDPPPVNLVIELKKDHSIELALSGKENTKREVPAAAGGYNQDALTGAITEIKGRWPAMQAATLQAENSVEYRAVIQTMENTRKQIPAVLLGGF